MKKILLQGDSITDCYRPRENDRFLGSGYPEFVKAEIVYKYGKEYELINRGVSGNRITDLYSRVKQDIINLKPDYLSILIGVNDFWHELEYNNGVDTDKFETMYCLLIDTIKEALPNIKIFLLEPFVLKYSSTRNTEEQPERWNNFNNGVRERAAAVKRVAEKYSLPFIPLQKILDEETERLEIEDVTVDGVHPTPTGHLIISREWLKTFESIINE